MDKEEWERSALKAEKICYEINDVMKSYEITNLESMMVIMTLTLGFLKSNDIPPSMVDKMKRVFDMGSTDG